MAFAKSSVRRAFTLIELMVVLLILSLVLAILLPAIGGARVAAKNASSLSLMKSLSDATSAFKLEKGTNPGYFSAVQMGSAQNVNRGFSALKNIMLDLAGGITTQPANPAIGVYDSVGPTSANTVTVDINQMGASAGKTKAYYQPRGDSMVAFTTAGQQVATAENAAIPDLVDSFGNPILAWVQDERPSNNFASLDSSTPGKFYWASNAGFLRATTLGKGGRNQRYTGAAELGSMIGDAAPNRPESLAGLLGNSAFAVPNTTPAIPSAARGQIVFHSAGADGVYLNTLDRGGKAGAAVQRVLYTPGLDVTSEFDDVLLGAGN